MSAGERWVRTTAQSLIALMPYTNDDEARLTHNVEIGVGYAPGRSLGCVPTSGPDDVADCRPLPSRWTIAILGSPNPVPSTAVKMIRSPSGVQVDCTARV